MKLNRIILGGMLATFVDASPAFEISTHAAISHAAFDRFVRESPNKVSQLGFVGADSIKATAFLVGETYLDFVAPPNSPRERYAQDFERLIARRVAPDVPLASIIGAVLAGAIREDDWPLGDNPHDDAYGGFRPLNHFYDPVRNRGLTVLGASLGVTSPRWGTGATDPFVAPNSTEYGRLNHYSILDAKEALFRALTLKSRDGISYPNLPGVDSPTNGAAQRNAYWATMFRALGDIVHLVQDMAQPQHTRNDAHAGKLGAGHASTFEAYLESRAAGRESFAVGWPTYKTAAIAPKQLPFQFCPTGPTSCVDYPTPKGFTQYSQFWSTAPGLPSGGKGLADFSNNRFFSAGTNLGHNQYGSPPNAPTAYAVTSVPATHWDGQPATWTSVFGSGTAPVQLYNYRVDDNLNPTFSVAQVPLTSASVFDEFLRRAQFLEAFHLSHENYDAQADLLIPRAVAYSAGLLEYFFRGSMQISLPSAGIYGIVDHAAFSNTDARAGFKGFGKIKLKLRNTTPNAPGTTTPEALSNGSLFAVLKFRRNTCYVDSLDGEIVQIAQATTCRSTVEEAVVSDPINNVSVPAATTSAPNGIEYTFFFPKHLPINAWDVVLQVVYRGRLGNEDDAVVVTTKDISEPTFITIRNDTDYLAIGSTCYKPEAIAANDALWNALAASCRDGSGATRKVAAACINVPFNLRYSFGTAFPPVGVAWESSGLIDRRMQPRRFGRVAILEEDTAPTNWALAFNNAPYTLVPGGGSALAVDPYSVQSDASRSVADVHVVSRGLRLWEGIGVMVDGPTAAVGIGCTGAPLDGLAGAERTPAPAAIIGW